MKQLIKIKYLPIRYSFVAIVENGHEDVENPVINEPQKVFVGENLKKKIRVQIQSEYFVETQFISIE